MSSLPTSLLVSKQRRPLCSNVPLPPVHPCRCAGCVVFVSCVTPTGQVLAEWGRPDQQTRNRSGSTVKAPSSVRTVHVVGCWLWMWTVQRCFCVPPPRRQSSELVAASERSTFCVDAI